jgi:hypothetical protein
MTEYTIEINEKNAKAKRFLLFLQDYAKDNDFVKLEKTPNTVTRKAIDDARKGKTFKAKNAKSLFESIR